MREARLAWAPVAALWAYAVLTGIWLYVGWGGSAVTAAIANWNPAPPELALLIYVVLSLRRFTPGLRRRAWILVVIAVAVGLIGNLLSPFVVSASNRIASLWDDAIFVIYYAILAGAYAMFFVDLGGAFRGWRIWIDIATLTLSLGATLWLFLISPALIASGANSNGLFVSLLYAPPIGAVVIMAALLFMQIMDWRNERALRFLMASVVLEFMADLDWLRARISVDVPLDSWFNVVASCTVCALVATAVKFDMRREVPERSVQGGEVNPQSFLPTLAVLLAIAMLFGEQAYSIGIGGWILLACALGGAALLTARQLGARYELRRLQLTLAMRQADERLTELVRRSTDLVLIIDATRQLAYVSPASGAVMGIPPAAVRATPATRLLGLGNETRLSGFLDDIAARHLPAAEMTAAFTTPNGERRDVQIVGSDQRASPMIGGIVLNIRDVTDQYRLEREVLEAVTVERCRLSSDIHEGLGQELAGIALLLSALQSKLAFDPDAAPNLLYEITGQFSRTIEQAREIARGLSPLQVVHGSLDQALIQLAADMRERYALSVNVHGNIQDARLSAGEADHIYRIAVEALNNAARHSRCSNVDVALHADHDQIRLSVIDNGVGFALEAESGKGLGLRMMGYRARAMGGSIRIEQLLGGGTRIVVSVPFGHHPASRDSMP
jgi:signal transduction histidine kinase